VALYSIELNVSFTHVETSNRDEEVNSHPTSIHPDEKSAALAGTRREKLSPLYFDFGVLDDNAEEEDEEEEEDFTLRYSPLDFNNDVPAEETDDNDDDDLLEEEEEEDDNADDDLLEEDEEEEDDDDELIFPSIFHFDINAADKTAVREKFSVLEEKKSSSRLDEISAAGSFASENSFAAAEKKSRPLLDKNHAEITGTSSSLPEDDMPYSHGHEDHLNLPDNIVMAMIDNKQATPLTDNSETPGRPHVEAFIGGNPVHLLVDTGSDICSLPPACTPRSAATSSGARRSPRPTSPPPRPRATSSRPR